MHAEFLAKTLTYWDKISHDERQLILESIMTVKFSAGETVHNAIDDCIGMLLVKTGELRTYILSDKGKEFTLFRVGVGGVCVLSARCLLNSITFDAMIEAQQDCELLLIRSSVLSRLHEQNPLIENFALKSTVEKFSAVVGAMETMLFMSLGQRVAAFLLGEYEKGKSYDIPLTHEQIAKYIGSAREAVSRTVKQLEKENMVSLSRGGIRILDLDSLAVLAQGES